MAVGGTPIPLVGLISQTLGRLIGFGRLVLQLAGAEMGEGIGTLLRGIIAGAIAGVVFVLALVFLLIALVQTIVAHGLAADAAYGVVGGGLLLVCIILVLLARDQIKRASLVPRRAIAQAEGILKAATEVRPHE